MRNKVIESILDRRNRPNEIKQILKSDRKRKESRRNSPTWKRRHHHLDSGRPNNVVSGVYRGNYFRVKIPNVSTTPKLPKISPVAPPPNLSSMVQEASHSSSSRRYSGKWFYEWFQDNWMTALLNFGSICTLAAFTRTDTIELRSLSATGSLCNALYHFFNPSSNFYSVAWPGIFASVNGYKITEILIERKADVHMTKEEQEIYTEHFLQHGVTPKMFQLLYNSAEKLEVKKNEIILRKGATVDHVYLVVSGSTSASILGRHLTAQSTSPEKRAQRLHSGTWIGEINYLDWVWEKTQPQPSKKFEHNQQINSNDNVGRDDVIEKSPETRRPLNQATDQLKPSNPSSEGTLSTDSTNRPAEANVSLPDASQKANVLKESLYTIKAKDDCVVWRWTFDEMDQLMKRSIDMRGAITRAMTSAVTAKVVNLTLSRATHLPTWSVWLSDWTREDGASVELTNQVEQLPEEMLDPKELSTEKGNVQAAAVLS